MLRRCCHTSAPWNYTGSRTTMAAVTFKRSLSTLSTESRQYLQPVSILTQRYVCRERQVLTRHEIQHNGESDLPNEKWTYMEEGHTKIVNDETIVRTFTLQDKILVKKIKVKKKKMKKVVRDKPWSESEMLALCKVVDICRRHSNAQRTSKETLSTLNIYKEASLRKELQNLQPKTSLYQALLPNRSFSEVRQKIQTVNFELKYSAHLMNSQRSHGGSSRRCRRQIQTTAKKAMAKKFLQKAKTLPSSVSSPAQKWQKVEEDKLRVQRCRFLDKCLEAQTRDLLQLSTSQTSHSTLNKAKDDNSTSVNDLPLMENVRESRKSILDACLQAQISR
ncbi:uncharacterized protein [Ptychodera flava]|uniref:uncharacterized protein n=1 Tax=Ptychodera flava TaxID=63121 RepID=UPI003969EFD1